MEFRPNESVSFVEQKQSPWAPRHTLNSRFVTRPEDFFSPPPFTVGNRISSADLFFLGFFAFRRKSEAGRSYSLQVFFFRSCRHIKA